jgi:transcriptional regulator with XRE-family HTH domain
VVLQKFSKGRAAFGAAMVAMRKKHKLDQREYARRVGISQSMVSEMERGQRDVAVWDIEHLARGYGESEKALFDLFVQLRDSDALATPPAEGAQE